MIFFSNIFSRFRTCVGFKSSSKMMRLILFKSASSAISSAFPLPIKNAGSGFIFSCNILNTVVAPAVSASISSSSRCSCTFSFDTSRVASPTSIASSFSTFFGVSIITIYLSPQDLSSNFSKQSFPQLR